MKVSLNWLTDYVDVSMPVAEMGLLFTNIGTYCDEIIETATDIVLDLEVTSNRPDLLGHIGVARELATATGAKFHKPEIGKLATSGKVEDLTSVEVPAPDLCPRYTARVVRGVKIGPSPSWLVEKLEAIGMRSVNNIVDVTNFVLMEYSQPLHCFDYDKLAGNRIVVRHAAEGEHLVSIDETKCRLDESMLVIADADKPVAIAGVMGGLDSEVSENTTNVLIESAQFDPLNVRRTSRKLSLMSESNYRFERKVDPVAVDEASLRACQLIIELAGGELAEGMIDVWAEPFTPQKIELRPARCNAIFGVEIPTDRQVELLDSLGLEPKADGNSEKIVCTQPSHRPDLTREIDLIEEITRLHGYDKIPVSQKITLSVANESLQHRTHREIINTLNAAGFDEAVTFTFIDVEEDALFGATATVQVDTKVRKTNNALRSTLLPSLLRACKTNQDSGNADVSLFELAEVFPTDGKSALPNQHEELAMVTTGDLRDLRGALEALVRKIDIDETLSAVQCDSAGFATGAACEIKLGDEIIGTMGIISPKVQDRYGLEKSIAAAAVRFEAILARAGRVKTYRGISKFPAIQRDLSVIVDEEVTWQQIVETITQIDQPLRESSEYVTTYRGKPVAKGRKSVTLSLIYRSGEGTLRGEQVDEAVEQILKMLGEKHAAEIRE